VAKRYPFLHKRGDVFYFFWHDEAGKRVEESLRTKDSQIANQRYHQRTDEIRTGRSPNDLSGWALKKAVDRWLEDRRLRASASGCEEYVSCRAIDYP
jgi:hypothetical protein